MNFDVQSGKDLEFGVICELLAGFCKSQKAKENALNLGFFDEPEQLSKEFDLLEEIQSIHLDAALSFPHPNAEDIDTALNILRIENGVLILSELLKVYALCQGTKLLIEFARNQHENYPIIFEACQYVTGIEDVLHIIIDILDTKKLDIKDDATPMLQSLRKKQKVNRSEINKNFEKALRHCKQKALLGDSEESFLENRRLLSVLSQYKKHVPGKIYGISAKGNYTYIEPQEIIALNAEQERFAKGNYTYIEPQEIIALNAEQERLRMEESNELFSILENVTLKLRSEKSQLKAFQRLLVRFDLLSAKVIFGQTYNGIRPLFNKAKKMHWKNAIHPLLYLKNQSDNKETIGQEIEMSDKSRFLVISGPNAGS